MNIRLEKYADVLKLLARQIMGKALSHLMRAEFVGHSEWFAFGQRIEELQNGIIRRESGGKMPEKAKYFGENYSE